MKFPVDLLERTLATYGEAFVGLLLVNWGSAINLSVLETAAVAAVPAALAVVKGFLSKFLGNPDSASATPDV